MMDDTLPKMAALSRAERAVQYNTMQYNRTQYNVIHPQHDERCVAEDGGAQQS